MAKIEFNWSTLTRDKIFELCYSVRPFVINKELPIDEFHTIFKNHLKKHFPILITKKFFHKIPVNRVSIGGAYYSDYDKINQKCIQIETLYNPSFPFLKLSASRFKRVCMLVADTILHEIIHMRQYRRREFKILPDYASAAKKSSQRKEQGYLGNSDEIDAYGFNIACELYSRFQGNRREVVKHLNKNLKTRRSKNDTWKMYLKAFDHRHDHVIIKRLKKKIIRYLPYAGIGKPYLTTDWIRK
jgi:hypothetical protein